VPFSFVGKITEPYAKGLNEAVDNSLVEDLITRRYGMKFAAAIM
jgi:hypothetical protein